MAKDEPAEELDSGIPDISDPEEWPLDRVMRDSSLSKAAAELADSLRDQEEEIIITDWP